MPVYTTRTEVDSHRGNLYQDMEDTPILLLRLKVNLQLRCLEVVLEVRACIGVRDINGGLGRESAAMENSKHDIPAKDHPDIGQVPSVPLVAGGTRWIDHRGTR